MKSHEKSDGVVVKENLLLEILLISCSVKCFLQVGDSLQRCFFVLWKNVLCGKLFRGFLLCFGCSIFLVLKPIKCIDSIHGCFIFAVPCNRLLCGRMV